MNQKLWRLNQRRNREAHRVRGRLFEGWIAIPKKQLIIGSPAITGSKSEPIVFETLNELNQYQIKKLKKTLKKIRVFSKI